MNRGILFRFFAFTGVTAVLTAWIAAQIIGVELGDRYALTATFGDVSGLHGGDVVKLAGVDIGEVTSVHVDDGQAVVGFAIDEDVAIPEDSEVEVRWRNLIGQRYLSILPGASTSMLADGDTVRRSSNVVDLGQLVNQLAPLARSVSPDQLNTILTGLLEAYDGNEAVFDGLLHDLDSVLATLAGRDSTITSMIDDYESITSAIASRDQQIQAMVTNLATISQSFADNDALLDDALVQFAAFSTNLDRLLAAAQGDLGSLVDNLAIVAGTFTDNLDELETALRGFPSVFSALLPAVNQGEWIRVNLLCVTVYPGPCPVPTPVEFGQLLGVG